MSSTLVPCPGRSGSDTVWPAAANASASGRIDCGLPVKPWTTSTPTSAFSPLPSACQGSAPARSPDPELSSVTRCSPFAARSFLACAHAGQDGAVSPLSVAGLLKCRAAAVLDERTSADGSLRLLVRSDLSGTGQLYEWSSTGLRPLTDFPGPVSSGRYVPGGSLVALTTDTGGDERHQVSLLDLDDPPGADLGKLTRITDDARFVHGFAGISRDGRHLAFVSNRRNGVDFDVWLHDRASGDERCLYDAGGWCSPASGFSPDGTWLAVRRAGPRPMDNDVLLLPTRGEGAPF